MLYTLVNMEIEILEEKENQLLNRKELKLNLKHENAATPSKAELMKELVAKYSVPDENIVIDYIHSQKGIGLSTAKVKIYKEKPKVKTKKEKVKEEKSGKAQTSEAK